MFNLIAATFSSLKGTAIALAAINAAVLAVALVLLFFLYRTANKKRGNTTPRPKNKAPEFSAECSIMATAATKVKSK